LTLSLEKRERATIDGLMLNASYQKTLFRSFYVRLWHAHTPRHLKQRKFSISLIATSIIPRDPVWEPSSGKNVCRKKRHLVPDLCASKNRTEIPKEKNRFRSLYVKVHDTFFFYSSLKKKRDKKKRQSRDATNPKVQTQRRTHLSRSFFFNEKTKKSVPHAGHKGLKSSSQKSPTKKSNEKWNSHQFSLSIVADT
jgi:hypothetical protein